METQTQLENKGRPRLMTKTCFALLVTIVALVTAAPASSRALPQLFGTVGPGSTFIFKDKAGKHVRSIKPGKYTVTVQDFSRIQNFHLVGPDLNLRTSVSGKGSSGWAIVLKAGTFKYYSDGSPSKLKGSFSVR
jgi:hypothetical protein